MVRTIASVICGLVAWAVAATILNFGLRGAVADYHAAEATLQFTMAMKVGRLLEAAAASLVAGAATRAIAPASRVAPWATGFLTLAMFIPAHVQLWDKFPLWYHLTFLLSIVPLVALGAAIWSGWRGGRRPA